MKDYEQVKYKSFDDFYTRTIKQGKRPFSIDKKDLCSPCDGKISSYKIRKNLTISIKNSVYSVEALIKDQVPDSFIGGTCVVLRLAMEDYHRYSFFDEGLLVSKKTIPGFFYSVHPVAYEKYKVFFENHREVSLILARNFGTVLWIEVGSTNVGKIHNYAVRKFKKGDEKGYFSFGASTIILFFEKGAVKIDESIEQFADSDVEVEVKLGEVIGKRK